ncbi:MAG: hypothetical protein HF982_11310 [Desulfobacteraceae bacterium]|nr:hypothetical protein [Desulfobacteraceae bacterium]MBC2720154.1 SBBP repeat-containing protein [Desulfobacteraceae bacterium]
MLLLKRTHLVSFLVIFFLCANISIAEVTEKWVARYNGPGNGDDRARSITIDAAGNIYVTGWNWGGSTDYDYATIKYDDNGNELWVARYNGPGNGDDRARSITIDAEGNIYVTGWSEGIDTGEDYATIKYDGNGNELWVARYNGPGNDLDWAWLVDTDAAGNVYVTGRSVGIGTERDYATIKYDGNGNELWVARYNGPGNYHDDAWLLAVDALDNVYVSGSSWGIGTERDYATVKYDANGDEQWVARYNGPGNDLEAARAMTVDNTGNIYVGGYSFGNGTFFDCATVKYDPDGNELWVARYNGPGNGDDGVFDITVDVAGSVYVTGGSEGIGTGSDYPTIKCNYLEAKVDGPLKERPKRDYATIKYDGNGNELWVARYNGPGNGEDRAFDITLDVASNVYVTGYSWGSDTDFDYATIKYDTNGNEQWVARYNGPGNDTDWGRAMAMDSPGKIYVTGWSIGTGTSYDYATIKYVSIVTPALECLTPSVPQGGKIIYNATFTNNTDLEQTFYYTSKVKLPDGSWYKGWITQPTEVTLGPQEIRAMQFTDDVHSNAYIGKYEYLGLVGLDKSTILDYDSFYFMVTPVDVEKKE